MRVLQVLAGAGHGGAETAFVDMCMAMHETGVIVEVVTRANPVRVPQLEAAGIRVHCLPFGGKLDLFTPLQMRRIIKGFKPDIVQCWMSRASEKTPRWNKSSGIPPYLVVSRLGGYYKLKYFRNVDYFVSITPDIKRYLVENGVPEENCIQINNFAETEAVEQAVNPEDYGFSPDQTILLGLGRLHESKAFDTLIRAVAEIPNACLWIAGEGPLRAQLEALIKFLDLESRVKLLGWRSDRAALFQASDICVFSSRYEPFGTVFVQAWAQKTPLVTTCADGPRQFVRDGEDGLVVDIDDVNQMIEAVKRIMNEPELHKNLIENGYQRYLNEFTKQQTVNAYLDFYKSIRARRNI